MENIIYSKFNTDQEMKEHLDNPDKLIQKSEELLKQKNYNGDIETRYVLFMDILGFSQLIQNNSSKKIKQIYESHFIGNYSFAFETAASRLNISHLSVHKLQGNISQDLIQNKFELHIMSDSIIVWTKDDSVESFKDLCKFASSYLALNLWCGLPLRGGVSKGDIVNINKDVNNIAQTCIVGKGVVNAYHTEQKQNWMGIAIDDECITGLTSEDLKTTPIVNYVVPMKVLDKGTCQEKQVYENKYVVNWTLFNEYFTDSLDFFNDCFSKYNKPIQGIENKIQNTYKFFIDMKLP
jgi:hypothetical protein